MPQNKEQVDYLTKLLGISKNDFIQMGMLNLKPKIDKLEKYNLPYSVADNDLHFMSKTKCCCGEPLVKKSTDFNNTALFFRNKSYSLVDVKDSLGKYGCCKANHLFTSNRQDSCTTVLDFFEKRFNRQTSPFSKKFMYGFADDKQKRIEDY